MDAYEHCCAMSVCVFLDISPLHRYIRSTSMCNTLALLVSQGTTAEYLQRLSLLSKLQNCWTKGHNDIKLHCSSDDDFHDDLCSLSAEEFTCETHDSNAVLAVSDAKTGNTSDLGGDCSQLFNNNNLSLGHSQALRLNRRHGQSPGG